jgi:ribonuclease/clavin/mitogillin
MDTPSVPIVKTPLEVADGVRMLSLCTPTLPPATHTNAYLVGTRELVLVEPASPYDEDIERAARWVEEERAKGSVLRAFLLTHHHPDHMGGAARLRERLGAPIWAHARTAERLVGKVTIDRLLEHGDRIELDGPTPMALECIHTPGHAPGHLCFYEPASESLIAGDMVASVGTILVDVTDGDMRAYLESLAALDRLALDQLLPAHGLPIDDPHERLRFYIQHRLAREAKVLAALAQLGREAEVHEIVPIAYADTNPLAWPLGAMSAAAHLIKLEHDGKVARRGERWLALKG